MRDLCHLTFAKRIAHPRRGDGRALAVCEQADRDHLEAVLGAQLGKPRDVAFAAAADGEVFAHDQQAQACLLDEHAHEVLGRHERELRGELQHGDPVDAGRPEQLDAPLERGEVGERRPGPQHCDGVGMERHHTGAETARPCLGASAFDEHLVAPVHAVEHAECEGVLTRSDGVT